MGKSIFAGMMIAIAGMIYLTLGGIEGAIMFNLGLLGVTLYQANLFTGKAGFLSLKEYPYLFYNILFGNILGVSLVTFLLQMADYDVTNQASKIILTRIEASYIASLIKGIFCGVLMTVAVQGYKMGNILPLLWCVPVFILSGYYHSIADWFYFGMNNYNNFIDYFPKWIIIVCGNVIGCNLPRLLVKDIKINGI